jgi:hypothetical protein
LKVSNWIIWIACFIIGIAGGVLINEAFDVLGSFGFGRFSELQREYDGLIGELEKRDKLSRAMLDSYRQRIESDAVIFGAIISEERSRADGLAEENRLLRAGTKSIGIGQGKVRDGLQAIKRIRGITDSLESEIYRDSEGGGGTNTPVAHNSNN